MLGFLLLIPFGLFSQDDSLAKVLVKRHVLLNKAKMTMSGYRVQIHYGNNRTRATEIKAEFILTHPDIPTYLIYQQPNFKVRLGDFKTRIQAQELLDNITADYPASFIVRDEVKLPE